MEIIENNFILLLSVFIMLLGAFIMGYLFGISGINKKDDPDIDQKDSIQNTKSKIRNYISTPEDSKGQRLEIGDIQDNGTIRAMKTRERAGIMSDELKVELTSNNLQDFKHLGEGTKDKSDDLKKIVGIGKNVEQKLNTIGIYNYLQLAQMNDEDIRSITKIIDFFPGRIHRDDWKGQAKDLMKSHKND